MASWDPELAECLRLYGNEEGWHRELLTEFLAYVGGTVRPMGRVTGTFYKVYGMAKRVESIVLTNLMFETIGSTTYRLFLHESDLDLTPPSVLLRLFRLDREKLARSGDPSAVSVEAAEAVVERDHVVVTAL